MTAQKIRENRLRRVAARRGMRLLKSRRRDEKALDFGRFWLVSRSGSVIAGGLDGISLDEIEEHSNERPRLSPSKGGDIKIIRLTA